MDTMKNFFSISSTLNDGSIFKNSKDKILLRSTKNSFEQFDKKINVIHITDSISGIESSLKTFSFNNFPDVFAFSIKITGQHDNFQSIQEIIKNKTQTNRSILLEVLDEQKKYTYMHDSHTKSEQVFWKELTNMTHLDIKKVESKIIPNNFFVNVLSSFKDVSFINVNTEQVKNVLHHDVDLKKVFRCALLLRDEIDIRLLNLVLEKESREVSRNELKSLIESEKTHAFLAVFNAFNVDEISKKQVEEILKINGDALTHAVESRNINVVKILLNYGTKFKASSLESSFNLALTNEFFDVCKEINNANLNFKDKAKLKALYDETIEDISGLHKNIQVENFDGIEQFIRKFPYLKICIDDIFNICALECALKHKKFKIYTLLVSKGFKCDKHEQLLKKIEELEVTEKEALIQENLNFMSDADAYRKISGLNCFLFAGKKEQWKTIEKMINDLNTIEEIRKILQINSLENAEFYFDLNREHVDVLNPMQGKKHAHLEKNKVYLGNCGDLKQLRGEFCRQASFIATQKIFQNEFLPFYGYDNQKHDEFIKVMNDIRKNYDTSPKTTDKVVKNILISYKEDKQRSRMIAMVPFLLGYFLFEPYHLHRIENLYAKLFQFYRNHVLSKFNHFIDHLKNALNAQFEVLEGIEKSPYQINPAKKYDLIDMIRIESSNRGIVCSNVPQLTYSIILRDIDKFEDGLDTKSRTIFVNTEKLNDLSIKKNLDDLLQLDEIKCLVVDGKNTKLEKYNFLDKVNSKIRIIIVAHDTCSQIKNYHQFQLNYNWKHLSDDSKTYILNSHVTFQRQKIKFCNLLTTESSIKEIPQDALYYLCSENYISINSGNHLENCQYIKASLIKTDFKNVDKSISFEDFIESVKNEKIVLISDMPKTGKTVLMKQLYEKLMSDSPEYWVSFIESYDLKLLLLDEIQYISKILQINPLEKFIFDQKFSKGQVKFLFDEIDEVLCNSQERIAAIKLSKKHKKERNCQIFMTCRPHLESDFQSGFDVTPYKIKPFTHDEQIEYLKRFWRKTNDNLELIGECAELVVSSFSSVLNTPQRLHSIADHFKLKLTDNFEKEIGQFNLYTLYEILVKSDFKNENILNFEDVCGDLELLAVSLIDSNSYGRKFPDAAKIKQIIPTGIIFYREINRPKFACNYLWSFFLSKFIIKTLTTATKNFNYIEEFEKLYRLVLNNREFYRVRNFLNDCSKQNLTISEQFLGKFKFSENDFYHTIEESLIDICVFNIQLIEKFPISKISIFKMIMKNPKILWSEFERILRCTQNLLHSDFDEYFFKLDDENNNLFHIAFMHCSDEYIKKTFAYFDLEKIFVPIFLQINNSRLSVLSLAIVYGKTNHVQYMIEILSKFSSNPDAFKVWKKAMEESFYTEDKEVFEIVKNISSKFSQNFSFEVHQICADYDKILNDIKELHENINTYKNESLQNFIEKHPRLKKCYDTSGISALERSIKAQNSEAFCQLKDKKFATFNGADLETKIKESDENFRIKIGKGNEKLYIRNPNSHIYELFAKCRQDTKTSTEDSNKILESFKTLNQVKELKNIMKNLAFTKQRPTIFFDTKNENLSQMLPLYDYGTMGLFTLTQNKLYIAKDATDEARNGTIAHEMAHCALKIVYKNKCLPYEESDHERKKEWRKVVKNIKEMYEADPNNTEPIIANVFKCYEDDDKVHEQYLHEAEMAVRVPHMLAHYQNNPEKIAELQQKYSLLFKFYEVFIDADFNVEYGTELRELNDEFGLLQKIQKFENIYETNDKITTNHSLNVTVIETKFQDLMLSKIYNEIRIGEVNPTKLRTENIFLDLSDERFKNQEKDLLQSMLEFFGQFGKKRLIILANSRNSALKLFLQDLKNHIKVFIITSLTNFLENHPPFIKNYNFTDFAEKSQLKLLGIKIYTNNTEIKLRDFILNNSDDDSNESLKYNETVKQLLTSDVIYNLITNKSSEIIINDSNDEGKNPNYTPRELTRSTKNEIENFNEDKLIEKISTERTFLISDLVGSGKTETLKELTRKFKIKYPNYWISFLTLKDNKSDYLKVKDVDIKEFMSTTILKLDSEKNFLEKSFFNFLYDQKRVIFLFDGFDEINPDCKEQVLKIFKGLRKSKKVKIWVTSRQHLEEELKNEMKNEPFKIVPLAKRQQVEYLQKSWSDVDANDEEYAKKLVETLSDCVKGSDFFGLPLQAFLLSQIFKEKHQRSGAVQKLTLLNVFTKFFEVKNAIWINSMTFQNLRNVYDRSLNSMQIHEFIALSLFNNDRKCMFNMSHNINEWTLNDIQMCGVITYDSEEKLRFVHQSLAEFLIAKFIFNFLNNLSEVTSEFADLFLIMLCDNKYQVVRVFFNYMVNDLEMDCPRVRKVAEGLCEKINRKIHSELLSKQIQENATNLVNFVLNICIKFAPVTARKISIRNYIKKFHQLIESCDLDKSKKEMMQDMFKRFTENKKIGNVVVDLFLRFIFVRRLPINSE